MKAAMCTQMDPTGEAWSRILDGMVFYQWLGHKWITNPLFQLLSSIMHYNVCCRDLWLPEDTNRFPEGGPGQSI